MEIDNGKNPRLRTNLRQVIRRKRFRTYRFIESTTAYSNTILFNLKLVHVENLNSLHDISSIQTLQSSMQIQSDFYQEVNVSAVSPDSYIRSNERNET